MTDLLSTGGAGAGGTIIGAVLAFLGFKSKIKDIDKRIDNLTKVVQFESTCEATHKGLDDKFDVMHGLMKETRDDVKKLLGEK